MTRDLLSIHYQSITSGFTSAGLVVWYSIPIAAERHRVVYALPNMLNVSFSLCSLLKLFLLGYIPGCCYLLMHMWRLRRRKIGGSRRRKAEKVDWEEEVPQQVSELYQDLHTVSRPVNDFKDFISLSSLLSLSSLSQTWKLLITDRIPRPINN